MLRKTTRYKILIVILICISAVSLVKVYHYQQKIKSYEQNISQQQNVISEHINELSELKDEIVALEEQGDLLQSLEELHIGWMNAEFLQEMSQKKYMTNENVCVRKAPSDHSAFQSYNVLSYDLVDVIYAVNTTHMLSPTREEVENGIWILIHFLSSEPEDTVGWVKWNELIEYTNDTMHMLRSPVKVSEDAIDLETGKPISSIFYDGSILRYEGDYAVISSEVGGRSCKIDKRYLKEGTTDLQTGKAAHMDHFKITKISDDRVSVVSEGGQGYEVAPQVVIYPAFEKE